jgi:hypothetical protein
VRKWRISRSSVAMVGAMVALGIPAAAIAVPVAPSTPKTGSLTQVGPLAEHGFPAWYKDSNGVRLEACVTLDDPMCPTLPDEVPNPDEPVSYPDNFPGEFFYQLAGATVTDATDGIDLSVGMDLEGAWAAEEVVDGDQMVFGRIRIRDKGIPDGQYRVIHPYGVDEFNADGGINYTQDIGTTPGAFGQALASRVGPFLKWDPAVAPAAPAGYVGDPGVDHKVVGSPYGTNYVAVQRKNAEGQWVELARTDLFNIQGRLAKNAGVDIKQATYSTNTSGDGFVDVYASSLDEGQSLQVQDAGLGFSQTHMRGAGGNYFAHLATTNAPDGKSVTVVNASDNPVATKTLKLVDVVTVSSATYDADSGKLTVTAQSSDKDSSPGALTVLGTTFTGNTVTIDTPAPPATVTVTSSKGGSTTVPVTAGGAGMKADKPEAAGFATPIDAAPGQQVTLNGTGSQGQITSYKWEQVDAQRETGETDPTTGAPVMETVPKTSENTVTLSNAAGSTTTFTAPQVEGPIAFTLVVSGPGGTSDPVKVSVDVKAKTTTDPGTGNPVPATLAAKAGDDQTVRRGTLASLDGSSSVLADTYKWEQVIPTSGQQPPTVTINGPNTAKPTFTFPKMPLPALNATTYTVNQQPITLKLTVTGQNGATATDEVVVRPQPETLAITAAEFRAGSEWRVSGTSTILAGQRVAVMYGQPGTGTGRVIGFANVDALGAWSFRGNAAAVPPQAITTVSAVSEMGDDQTGFVFRRR